MAKMDTKGIKKEAIIKTRIMQRRAKGKERQIILKKHGFNNYRTSELKNGHNKFCH